VSEERVNRGAVPRPCGEGSRTSASPQADRKPGNLLVLLDVFEDPAGGPNIVGERLALPDPVVFDVRSRARQAFPPQIAVRRTKRTRTSPILKQMPDQSEVQAKVDSWAETVRATVAEETRDRIIAKRKDKSLRVIQAALDFADQNIKGIGLQVNRAAASAGLPGIACRSGCAACCFVRVSVLPAEVFNLAAHVNETFTAEQRAVLIEKLRNYIESIAALPVEGRMRHQLACAFLGQDRCCTVYQARPLACRMHHSLSREACEDPNEPVPLIEDFINATVPVMEGIYDGTAMACTRPDELEFAPAMLIALEEPDAETRWLSGEEVFTNAVDLYLREYVANLLKGS
jgi:Fe-S-cluster containining protein